MNKVIFYSFKIENIDFQTTDNLAMSTPFVKNEVVDDLKQKLAASGYKMAADNSQKIIKVGNELFIEGVAYLGENPGDKRIQGYFKSIK